MTPLSEAYMVSATEKLSHKVSTSRNSRKYYSYSVVFIVLCCLLGVP